MRSGGWGGVIGENRVRGGGWGGGVGWMKSTHCFSIKLAMSERSSESCKTNRYILLANEYLRGERETIAGWEGSLSSSPNSGSHGNSGRLTSSSDRLSYILWEHTRKEEAPKAVTGERSNSTNGGLPIIPI